MHPPQTSAAEGFVVTTESIALSILVECTKFQFEKGLRLNSKPLEKVFTDISPQDISQLLREIDMYCKI